MYAEPRRLQPGPQGLCRVSPLRFRSLEIQEDASRKHLAAGLIAKSNVLSTKGRKG